MFEPELEDELELDELEELLLDELEDEELKTQNAVPAKNVVPSLQPVIDLVPVTRHFGIPPELHAGTKPLVP